MPKKTSTSSPSSRPRCSSRSSSPDVRLLCPSGLACVTLTIAASSRASQPRHAHDSLILGVVTAGTRRIDTNGTATLAAQGAVFVLAPGQAHACAPAEADTDANSDANSDGATGRKPKPDALSCTDSATETDEYSNADSNGNTNGKSSPGTPACSYLALSIAPAALPPELANFRLPSPCLPPPCLNDPDLAEALVRLAEALDAPTGLLERQSLLAHCLGLLTRHGCAETRRDGGDSGRAGEARMSAVVGQARRLIEENLETGVDLAGLAQACGVDMFALHRAFTRAVGLPPHSFQTHLRLRRAKELLRGGASLSEAALQSGFCDQAHMTRHFARGVGLSPARYARAHKPKSG